MSFYYFCRCDGKTECVVSVDSSSFHDACPGTLKYLEIHYACSSRSQDAIPSDAIGNGKAKPALPPWLKRQGHTSSVDNNLKSSNTKSRKEDVKEDRKRPKGPSAKKEDTDNVNRKSGKNAEAAAVIRKVPILVTERVTPDSDSGRRVPITTPRPTTSTTTRATSSTTSQKIAKKIKIKDVHGKDEIRETSIVRKPKQKPSHIEDRYPTKQVVSEGNVDGITGDSFVSGRQKFLNPQKYSNSLFRVTT